MYTPDNYPFTYTPFKHQWDTLVRTWQEKSWAFFLEMGTGKSKLLIDTAGLLYVNGRIDTVVVIAKKGEYANWAHTQFPEHLPKEFHNEVYLFSTARYRTAAGKKAFTKLENQSERKLNVLVINVEALATAPGREAMKRVYEASNDGVMIAVDESTCVKNIKAKRSKEVYVWASKSKYRRIMTGTPITQSPLDLWGQCLVLGRSMLGFKSFYAFRGRFAELETKHFGQRAIQVVKRYVNLEELSRLLSRFSTILTKAECLDLPDKLYKRLEVEMTPSQAKLYSDMKHLAMVELDGHEIEVTNVITQIVKLHQIACGQLKLSDRDYSSIENNRLPALMDLLEDYPGKVIIWANYRQTLEDVVTSLRDKYGHETVGPYYGGVSDTERAETIKRFQDPDDPLRFFVSNPQSGGYGLTLTEANLVVYYSNSYNLEHRLQSEDRAHRIGQTDKVTYVDLVCPGTVDERILDVLRKKKNLADLIMGSASLDDLF